MSYNVSTLCFDKTVKSKKSNQNQSETLYCEHNPQPPWSQSPPACLPACLPSWCAGPLSWDKQAGKQVLQGGSFCRGGPLRARGGKHLILPGKASLLDWVWKDELWEKVLLILSSYSFLSPLFFSIITLSTSFRKLFWKNPIQPPNSSKPLSHSLPPTISSVSCYIRGLPASSSCPPASLAAVKR